MVDGRISVSIHAISEYFAVSTDSCDMPSIRGKKFFSGLLDSIYFLNLDGIRHMAFQIGDGPPFSLHLLSHGRDRDDGNLEEKGAIQISKFCFFRLWAVAIGIAKLFF
jgi:hypothetical protein